MPKPQLFKRVLEEETYATLPEAIRFFHENTENRGEGRLKLPAIITLL